MKLATTVFALSMVTVQTLPETLSQPSQLPNSEPRSGDAVNLTTVTVLNVAEHVAPQLMPAGDEVTVPSLRPSSPWVFLTVRTAVTVKLPPLVAVPAEIVTVTFPLVAPVGTIA